MKPQPHSEEDQLPPMIKHAQCLSDEWYCLKDLESQLVSVPHATAVMYQKIRDADHPDWLDQTYVVSYNQDSALFFFKMFRGEDETSPLVGRYRSFQDMLNACFRHIGVARDPQTWQLYQLKG